MATWTEKAAQEQWEDEELQRKFPEATSALERKKLEIKNKLEQIEMDPSYILQIKNPDNDEFALAFDLNPKLAENFHSLPLTIQAFLLQKNPKNIQYILNPHEEIQLYIISNHENLIKKLKLISFDNVQIINERHIRIR